jgi:hypothetical protein
MPDQAKSIVAEATAICPFSIAQEYAIDFLREGEAGRVPSLIRVPVRYLPSFIKHRVRMTFGLHPDRSEAGRRQEEIRLRWEAGTPLLPNFSGTARFRIDGAHTRVVVEGSYTAPFGIAGAAFDALIGRRLALASIADLARRIAAYLEERQAKWRWGIMEQLAAR